MDSNVYHVYHVTTGLKRNILVDKEGKNYYMNNY